MTITGRGVQVIQSALDHIHNNPSKWNQSSWMQTAEHGTLYVRESEFPACNTACCFAGRVALNEPEFGLAVIPSNWDPYSFWNLSEPINLVAMDRTRYRGENRFTDDAVVMFLLQWSTNTGHDSDVLLHMFSPTNKEDDLWWYGQILTEGALTTPEGVSVDDWSEYGE